MNRYDVSYMIHGNVLDNIKRVFEEITIGINIEIERLNQKAKQMKEEDIENQLSDEYYYSETFTSVNNNIYLAHIMSSAEIYLKRLVSIYRHKNPSSSAQMAGRGSYLNKFENFFNATGCSFSFNDTDWVILDALRAIRNGIIHGEAQYSDVEAVGQSYITNNPDYFKVTTILDRTNTLIEKDFYIKDNKMLFDAMDTVKRVTQKITNALKANDI